MSKWNPQIRIAEYDSQWATSSIGDCCDMFNGDRSSRYPKAHDMVSDGLPFINAGDLCDGRVNLKTAKKITREKYEELGGAKLQIGDMVYCLRGTLGKNAFIDNFPEGTIASSLVAIRPRKIDGRFLFHVLNSNIEYRQRVLHDEGAAQPNLSAKSVAEFEIPLPEKGEQKKIAAFLDNIENLLLLHQREIKRLECVRKAMLDKMFPQDGSNVPAVRFEQYKNPWRLCKFSEIFMERHIIDTISDEYPQLAFTIEEGVIRPEDKKTNKRDFLIIDKATKKYLQTEYDDIIYNPANVIFGAIHRNSLGKGCVSPIYKIFYTDQDSTFMECIVRHPRFIKEISRSMEGTVKKLRTLKPKAFLEMSAYIAPTIEEQKQIGEYFRQIDRLIEIEKEELEKIKHIKSACLEKMFV